MISKPSLPKLPLPSKKAVLVTAGIIVILAITAFGIVRQEQQNRADAAKAVAAHNAQVAHDKAVAAQIQGLRVQTSQLTGQKTVLCNYIKSLEANKSTKAFVTTPTLANCSNPQ